MRVFVDISGSCSQMYANGAKGRALLDLISLYAEGYCVLFDYEIRAKHLLSTTKRIEIPADFGGGTDPNCLGPIHLGKDHELKVMLTDGEHPRIIYPCKNLLTIDPSMDIDPKSLALHLSFIDATFKRLDMLATRQEKQLPHEDMQNLRQRDSTRTT